MSLRLCVLRLMTFNVRKSHYLSCINSRVSSEYQFSTSSNVHTLTSVKVENLQFPKQGQPLANLSVDEVLSSLNSKPISDAETVSVLKMLRMFRLFKNENSDSYKSDQRFQSLCNSFKENCDKMNPNLLVSGLRSLLEVDVPPDSECVIAAEESIMKNIKCFSTFNLIGCLYFHHKFMKTDLQKKVVSLLISELCGRVSEITSNSEVLMLSHFLHVLSENDQKSIQHVFVELIRTLNAHEICKIFNTFAENSYRNIVILNALAFHLEKKETDLEIKEILDILYSFKKLNFFDVHLISKLLDQVVKELPSVKQPSIISGILSVCGHLRLRHIGVLDTCADWIVSHIEVCRPKEFISFILTIATLNYHSPGIQKAINTVLPLATFEKVESADVWLDFTWSLAVLNHIDKEILLNVLSRNFYEPLIDKSGFQAATNKLKLMNLKTVLKNSYPECVFRCNLYLDAFEIPQSSEIQNSRKHVLKVLSNFVPKVKYLCSNQSTCMGIYIDAEFIMDKNMKPLLLSQYGILSKVTDVKPLPEGAQRIALLVLFYKDFTLCSSSRTGFNDLAIRLLFSEGYTPVPIAYAEFMRNNTEVKKAKYLLQKITSIMKKVEDNDYKFDINLFN